MSSGNKIKTILIEDSPIAHAVFVDVIKAHPGLELVATATSWKEGCKALEQEFDLLITDLDLGDGSGLDLIARSATRGKKTIVITVLGDAASVMKAVAAGADGYVLKSNHADELSNAISLVLEGGSPISASVAGYLLKRLRAVPQEDSTNFADPPLTSREIETLSGLAKGYTNKEVARDLGISPNTVGEYVKSIYRKMAVHSRAEAVNVAIKEGLIR